MNWRDLWFDVSPMRPDEFAQQMAGAWTRAEAMQQAFRRGAEEADAIQRRAEDNKRKQEESLQRLRQER